MASELVQKQQRFFEKLAILLAYASAVVGPKYGVRFRMAEGYVGDSIDKPGEDSPHLRRGTHFMRLAQDLVMDQEEFGASQVVGGDHPAWHALGGFWKGLDPSCRWGGDFKDATGRVRGDWGHFSMEHGGVA
jgi:hypothetical protein